MVREKKKATVPGGKQIVMEGIVDKIPEELSDAVDFYVKKYRASRTAVGATKAARKECLELMKKHGIPRVPIDLDGDEEKVLELDLKESVKIRKRKDAPPVKTEDVAEEA